MPPRKRQDAIYGGDYPPDGLAAQAFSYSGVIEIA
jgi:hypothetical protein